jgi:hypothetical protein
MPPSRPLRCARMPPLRALRGAAAPSCTRPDNAAANAPAQPTPATVTPRRSVARLARSASNTLDGFVASERFVAMVDSAFAQCDVDGSGTIDAGELFAAILLLNHQLNMLPLGKRQQPPSREAVRALLEAHAHDKDGTLSRSDFLAVCQDLCKCAARAPASGRVTHAPVTPLSLARARARRTVATGVPRNVFITFVLCPAIGMSAKTALMRTIGGLHPYIGARERVHAVCDARARSSDFRLSPAHFARSLR